MFLYKCAQRVNLLLSLVLDRIDFQFSVTSFICETEGVIMKIKDYYKLSSTAAVVLQKYSETWSDWIDIKVEDIWGIWGDDSMW